MERIKSRWIVKNECRHKGGHAFWVKVIDETGKIVTDCAGDTELEAFNIAKNICELHNNWLSERIRAGNAILSLTTEPGTDTGKSC